MRRGSGDRRPRWLPVALAGAGVLVVALALDTHPAPRASPHQFGASAPVAAASPDSSTPRGPERPHPVSRRDAGPDGGSPPIRVVVPRLHVDALVVPVRSADGQIEVPDRPAVLGWWIGGAAPGSAVGSTVVVGHVDSASTGPGALFHLDSVRPHDRIAVAVTGGGRVAYRVESLAEVRKSVGLRPSLFTAAGAPRLVVITCGGPFDEQTKSYADNIVVVAVPDQG